MSFKNQSSTNKSVDNRNDKTQWNNSDDENVKRNSCTRISIKSIKDDDRSSLSSEILSSSSEYEFSLKENAFKSDNDNRIDLLGINNDNCQNERVKVNNLAVQNSNDVTIGHKTIYNGPITINQFLPNETSDRQKSDGNICDRRGNDEVGGGNKEAFSNFEILYKTLSSDGERFSKKFFYLLISTVLLILISLIVGITSVLLTRQSTEEDISPESWNIRIINRTEWGARPPLEELPSFVTTPYRALIAHTVTEECSTKSSCKLRVKLIQDIFMDKGYDDIGYNFLVGDDGMVYEGCGWNKIGIHTPKYNNNTICIAFIGNYMLKKPSIKQLKTAEWLLNECVKNMKLTKDYKLYGVRQVYPTLSPGDQLYNIITKWSHWSDDIE